jgi:Co/Zn/Cd efflux system component
MDTIKDSLFEPKLADLHLKQKELQIQRKIKNHNIIFYSIVGILTMFVGCAIFFTVSKNYGSLNVLLGLPIFGVGALIEYYAYYLWEAGQELNLDIARLDELESQYKTNPPVESEIKIFERLVDININNLAIYYGLIKNHTQKSFFASIISGAIGFCLLIVGIIVGYQNQSSLAFISSASGIITEFIAAIFFYLYSKTVRELKEYHRSLLDVQNILLSFYLVKDLQGEEKVQVLCQMINSLIARHDLSIEKVPSNNKVISNEI